MMPEVRVEGVCTEMPNEKRCYLPGITLIATCPECGKEVSLDLGEIHCMYGNMKYYLWCPPPEEDGDGCGHEWTVQLESKTTVAVKVLPVEGEVDEDGTGKQS